MTPWREASLFIPNRRGQHIAVIISDLAVLHLISSGCRLDLRSNLVSIEPIILPSARMDQIGYEVRMLDSSPTCLQQDLALLKTGLGPTSMHFKKPR